VNGSSDPSQVHFRDRSEGNFSVQHCEWDLSDTCDGHADESVGWVAFDASLLERVKGYGETKTGVAEPVEGISFTDRIEHEALLFAQVVDDEGIQPPRNLQVANTSAAGATIEFCEQDTSDGCDTHASEPFVWWAIDPVDANRGEYFDWGATTSGDGNWASVDFDGQSFSQAPTVIAMVQTENGGHEALYSEVKDVT